MKLLKEVNKPQYLNAWETFYINQSNKELLMNLEDSPILNSVLLSSRFLQENLN